ncbi:PAAR domain-containing protein [Roseinatronobacter alkalisoli]|uniref:PAAR domain-containing protein n=1 Tax=Roseinatronobacter alkalisoli TaxID=3028235 RepID=A0ABT5TAH6_9RHOB|nr:PAAR domain-containing protein [Roseinatronobacter sp. HJB301]MDD7971944.1 PAAR domain-containing protein [Roseinatronobacter sp. HJB301]
MPPAARISDLHVCPLMPPPGAPIISGAPTVITAFMPQARMSDMCTCTGSPDAIAFGSPTVLVCGMPAARMGDPTTFGGAITTGAPNVLIGMVGTGATPPLPPALVPPICLDLAQALAENQTAREMAQLADASYGDRESNEGLPEGYRRARPDEIEALGLSDGTIDMTQRPDSDFRADVFVRQGNDGQEEYVIAFKGSTTAEDWQNNLIQGTGLRGGRVDRFARERTQDQTDYYNEAALIGRTASAMAPGRVSFTGHSLGGGLASNAAAASGGNAHTFNAAGLHESTLNEFGAEGADPENVQAYYLADDPLNRLQDGVGMAPEAYGQRHRMETVNEWTESDRQAGADAVNPDNWIPDRLERAAGERAAQQMRFHGMEEMMESLDQQHADIEAARAANGCP